jgi:hypothetical protein
MRGAFREAVFELLTKTGTVAGIFWVLSTFDTRPAECPVTKGAEPAVFSDCLTDSFADVVYPALAKILAGTLAGALLAVVLIMTVPGLRRPRSI